MCDHFTNISSSFYNISTKMIISKNKKLYSNHFINIRVEFFYNPSPMILLSVYTIWG